MGVKRWWHLTVAVFLLASTVGATTFGTFTTTTFTTTTLTGATSTTSTLAGSLAPVANAGPDQFTQTLSTLTFNGSGSFDPGRTIEGRRPAARRSSRSRGQLLAHRGRVASAARRATRATAWRWTRAAIP